MADFLDELQFLNEDPIADAPEPLGAMEMPGEKMPLSMMDAPIPGQSLTQNPDTPLPFETPPEYNSVDDAADAIFQSLTGEESYRQTMQMLDSGVPATLISQSIIMFGASEGKWNMDMAMMLMEPVSIMVAGLGKKAGIDVVMTPPKKEPKDVDTERLSKMFKDKVDSKKPKGNDEAIEQVESMVARPEKSETPAPEEIA